MAQKKQDELDKIHQARMEKLREETALKMAEIDSQMSIKSRYLEMCRARAISVGTAFGGTVEITLKDHKGDFSFAIMQPVEVIEFIHTLASNIGCVADVRPRNDFASWRSWQVDAQDQLEYKHRHAPHPNDMNEFLNLGAYGDSGSDNSNAHLIGAQTTTAKEALSSSKKELDKTILDFIPKQEQEGVLNEDALAIKKNING
jgi:hypothetical protein